MADLVLNFAPSGPSSDTAGPSGAPARRVQKVKGGRWTDRVKVKRRADVEQRKERRASAPVGESGSAQRVGQQNGADPDHNGVLGKRDRRDEQDEGLRPKGKLVLGGTNSTAQPTGAPKQPGRAQAASHGQPKRAVGPDGKKQYISSLFSAEGLPQVQDKEASKGPIVPAQPSNAPLRHVEEQDEARDAQKAKDDRPSPAPALSALGLQHEIVSHLVNKLDITGPTACQASAIPPLIANSSMEVGGRDAVLRAQTGSGKTLTFLLPLVQDLLNLAPSVLASSPTVGTDGPMPSRSIGTMAIILAPTRELASQIYTVLEQLLTMPGSSSTAASPAFTVPPRALTPCLLVGGANRTHEKSRLRKGCPIIVATPGRLLDHLRTTESFRLAGEPVKAKPGGGGGPPGGRFATGANRASAGPPPSAPGERKLGLRWLVVDECDRLMDLGFEEQMKGVLDECEKRSPSDVVRRRTVLCSATANDGVDRLAGLALKDPITLTVDKSKGMVDPGQSPAKGQKRLRDEDASAAESKVTFTPPTQLVHNYVTCPPKLRFVALLALLRRLLVSPKARQAHPRGTKVLVFVSCTAAVDFYWQALGQMNMVSSATGDSVPTKRTGSGGGGSGGGAGDGKDGEKADSDDNSADAKDDTGDKEVLASHSVILPGVPIYRLHGSLPLSTRLTSLAAFSSPSIAQGGKLKGQETDSAVLICTSVAARGLDVHNVGHVVQYDLPTEGGVTEYVHRVGRTARAGAQGSATSLILPTEREWVPWVEQGMASSVPSASGGSGNKTVKLHELGVEDVLKDGFGGQGREYETRATDVQMGFERWVSNSTEHSTSARNAFTSHVRSYATHPSSEKHMFNVRSLHLGHLAKSFGLREAPSALSGGGGGAGGGAGDKTRKGAAKARKRGRSNGASGHNDGGDDDDEAGQGTTFETGRRRREEDDERRIKRLMKGPSGMGGSEFQIAQSDELAGLARDSPAGDGAGTKRKKRRR